MLKIAFHTPQFCLRGTSEAIYCYAKYNEDLLHNKSIMIVPICNTKKNDQLVLNKFSNRFRVLFYKNKEDMERLIKDCDILYCIKYGKNDGVFSTNIKTVIHCVFDLSEPHGDIYSAVSERLAQKFNTTLFVPHMIGLQKSVTKENMRFDLNIPEDGIVFGRHGGTDTFDLNFVKNSISRAVRNFPNLYFIFVNTPAFDYHENIYYLSKIVDLDQKNRFICSCDAMIHAQSLGETFGIAIGEFSVNNKKIITYGGPVWNDNYKEILKDQALYYTSEEECYNILTTFNPKEHENKNNNCYKEYSPAKVMKIFEDVFIN
jgi:hypothetical protein